MGQAKRRGTLEQRKAAAIADRRGYVIDAKTGAITPRPLGVGDDGPTFPRRPRPSMLVAHLAMMAAICEPRR